MLLPASGRQEKDNLWIHHFASRENSIFWRITLKEIIIMNEYRSVIEVEQSLKQWQSFHNQGL